MRVQVKGVEPNDEVGPLIPVGRGGGGLLVVRPPGREAYLVACHQLSPTIYQTRGVTMGLGTRDTLAAMRDLQAAVDLAITAMFERRDEGDENQDNERDGVRHEEDPEAG